MPKWYPKYSKTELGGYLGAHFLTFWPVCGGRQFFVVPKVSQRLSQITGNHCKSLEITGNHRNSDHPGCIFLSKCLQMLLVLLYSLSLSLSSATPLHLLS